MTAESVVRSLEYREGEGTHNLREERGEEEADESQRPDSTGGREFWRGIALGQYKRRLAKLDLPWSERLARGRRGRDEGRQLTLKGKTTQLVELAKFDLRPEIFSSFSLSFVSSHQPPT